MGRAEIDHDLRILRFRRKRLREESNGRRGIVLSYPDGPQNVERIRLSRHRLEDSVAMGSRLIQIARLEAPNSGFQGRLQIFSLGQKPILRHFDRDVSW